MPMISFTSYAPGNVDTVRSRLPKTANHPSRTSTTDVIAMSEDISQIVMRSNWDAVDENERRHATLAATRYAAEIVDAVIAS